MDIAELNTRVLISQYAVSQDGDGLVSKSLTDSWTRWAKVVQNSGSKTLESLAVSYKEAYTITKRFELDKPTTALYTITYADKELSIGSVIKKEIGNAWYEEITAYTTQ